MAKRCTPLQARLAAAQNQPVKPVTAAPAPSLTPIVLTAEPVSIPFAANVNLLGYIAESDGAAVRFDLCVGGMTVPTTFHVLLNDKPAFKVLMDKPGKHSESLPNVQFRAGDHLTVEAESSDACELSEVVLVFLCKGLS